MRTQRLLGEPFGSPTDVVDHLTAVQAQDYHGAKWGIAQRTFGSTSAQIDHLFNTGALLRTHILRPTWHFVRPTDIRWLLGLSGPRVHVANAHYYRTFELDDETLRRSATLLAASLAGEGYLTRREVRQILERGGVIASGPRLGYILMHAELEGLICSGPLRGKQHSYALLDERVPLVTPIERDEALARLTTRYFESHGPATAHDFSWWSGLTVSDVKRGIEQIQSLLLSADIDGSTFWYTALESPARVDAEIAHLLPNYDEYLIAFKNHSAKFDQVVLQRLNREDDAIRAHVVVIDGLVVGGWQRSISAREATVTTSLLRPISQGERSSLYAAAERFGRFLERPTIFDLTPAA